MPSILNLTVDLFLGQIPYATRTWENVERPGIDEQGAILGAWRIPPVRLRTVTHSGLTTRQAAEASANLQRLTVGRSGLLVDQFDRQYTSTRVLSALPVIGRTVTGWEVVTEWVVLIQPTRPV